jgi:hypothetical protein
LARPLCTWLRVAAHREVIMDRLKSMGRAWASIKHLTSFSCSFAKWRWETLDTVSCGLGRVEDDLKAGFLADDFRGTQDRAELGSVCEAIFHPRFWIWNRTLRRIVPIFECFRKWGNGCSCHEAECIDASSRHAIFKCVWKGCRLHELKRRVDKFIVDVRAFRDELNAAELTDDEFADMMYGCNASISATQRKTSHLNELPWLIWQCRDDRARCLEFVQQFDLAVLASPRREIGMHRVALMFASTQLADSVR